MNYNQCAYLNPEKQNSNLMLKQCIGNDNHTNQPLWPCNQKVEINNNILNLVTERPQQDNIKLIENSYQNKNEKNMYMNSHVEGFTNMGESYIEPGNCPDGYYKCPITNKCIQLCMNCKYNQKKYHKSKEFNEYDPCFPKKGVYDGIDNQGNIKCTCGSNRQYCNDNFTAEGGFFYDNVYIMNVGDFSSLGYLASY